MPGTPIFRRNNPLPWLLVAAILVPWLSATAEQPTPFARLDTSTAEQLHQQLLKIPEINLLASTEARSELHKQCKAEAAAKPATTGAPPALDFQRQRWQELGLTCRPESERLIFRHEAKYLAETALALRREGVVSLPAGERLRRPTVESLRDLQRALRSTEGQLSHQVTPALYQMVQAESDNSRALLVAALTTIDTNYATCCLAERAIHDLSPAVRQAAVRALATRPRKEFRGMLLEGLRYPWAPAAQHAAEALVALQDRDALPDLKKLLDGPDPSGTLVDHGKPVIREVVRLNHLRNCLLCHAPSHGADDLVVAPVPTPGEPLSTLYYGDAAPVAPKEGDLFVRADVTYLRQDFSVTQRVAQPNKWPDEQRFDFLVRQRPATAEEAARKPAATSAQRQAVLFAIERLAGDPARP
jgi:HEAT repeats